MKNNKDIGFLNYEDVGRRSRPDISKFKDCKKVNGISGVNVIIFLLLLFIVMFYCYLYIYILLLYFLYSSTIPNNIDLN